MFESIKRLFRKKPYINESLEASFGERPNVIYLEKSGLKEKDFDETKDSRKGSVSRSPITDKWRGLGSTHTDVVQRLELYNTIEIIFDSEPIAMAAAEKFACGAIGKQGPVLTSVELEDHLKDENGEPIDSSDIAGLMVAKRILTSVTKKLDASLLRKIALELYQFGNLPIRPSFGPSGDIEKITVLPPHGFQINSDSNHRFKPGQKDCYVQYDVTNLYGEPIGVFKENEIVFASYGKRSWDRYGYPPIFRVAEECQDLRKDISNLSAARDSLMPEVDYIVGKGDGAGVDAKSLDEFRKILTDEKSNVGFLNKYKRRILAGGSDVKIANPGVDYVNKLDDLVIHSQRITTAFNVAYALIMQDEKISDRVYTLLLETLYYQQSLYTGDIEYQVIRPLFKIALDKAGIDIDRFKINLMWFESQLPTRLQAKADSAVKFANTFVGKENEPMIDVKSAREAVCALLNLDPEVVAKACKEESRGKEFIPKKAPDFPSLQGNVLENPDTMNKYKKAQASGTAKSTDKPEFDGLEPQTVGK